MAKRRKKEEAEEDYDYEFPEFDRKEYMLDEIRKGKCVYISVAIAPIFSVFALYVFRYSGHQAVLGFLVGLAGLGVLKTLFQIAGIEIDELGLKEWAMSAGMYFFTFLAIWVVLMNPPFSDFAPPELEDVVIEFEEDGEIIAHEYVQENISEENKEYNVTIIATITDNTEVDHESVQIYLDGDWYYMEHEPDTHEYRFDLGEIEVGEGHTDIAFRMEDIHGNEAEVSERLDVRLNF